MARITEADSCRPILLPEKIPAIKLLQSQIYFHASSPIRIHVLSPSLTQNSPFPLIRTPPQLPPPQMSEIAFSSIQQPQNLQQAIILIQMRKNEAGQMRKSYLLSRDISLKDIIGPSDRAPCEKSAIFSRKDHQEGCDQGRELFKGLKFKNLGSMETTYSELTGTELNDSFKQTKPSPVAEQKLRQQYDKLKKSMSSTQLTRALTEQNEEIECNSLKTLKKMKKEDEIRKFNKIRKMSQSYALNQFNAQ